MKLLMKYTMELWGEILLYNAVTLYLQICKLVDNAFGSYLSED